MAEIGEVIDSRWEIIERFKESGQGHTFKVKDLENPSDKSKYVIKLLKKINDKSLARFQREIKASFALNHKNIVCAKANKYENTPEPYLVTELCSGGELDEEKIKKLSLIDKLKIFESICEAIAYAHESKVIHRDIKPRNIFLIDQKSKIPIVGDFGICFFEGEEIDERLTEVREKVRPKDFGPPEADFGIVEIVNPRFDVYSLGKLLYWFLSNGDVPIREHYNHQKFDLRNSISEQFIHIAYEMFDKSIREEPTERYQSAVEMLKDVKQLLLFVEKDARYLDCNILQGCIFCRNGKYEFVSSPNILGGKLNYAKSLGYGIDFCNYEGRSWHNNPSNYASYPRVLIARCDSCGNVQQFQLDNEFNTADNWKNIPKAE